jgi:tripartite-type tricarboxylate transporter receptor subunit TctC
MNVLSRLLAVTCLGTAAMSAAHAGSGPNGYPNRPVTVIVPFAPGGGSDNIARFIISKLSTRTGGNFIIENRAGAGTNIGNEYVARQAPDGQTLLFGQVTLAINPYIYKSLHYDVQKSFMPVAHIADSPTILLTNKAFPPKDLKAFIAYLQANPGKVNFGSGGRGTSVHLAGELFSSLTHTQMVHVPYKGSGPATTDLMGGQIQVMFDTAPSSLAHVLGGNVRALAVSGSQRIAKLPNIPTFAQAGLPQFDAPAWYGLLLPAGSPPAIADYLNQQVNAVLKDPDTVARLADLGSAAVGGSRDDFGKFIATESKRWSTVVSDHHIEVE